mmetsp:Transcript_13944/g.39532  ORF Transcript_13944/g.39532 Transcript_13944/m.39532 type:complete len:261 (-) Transcript_13944:76-858(-)
MLEGISIGQLPELDLLKVPFARGSGHNRGGPADNSGSSGNRNSMHIPDSPNKIFVGGVPHDLTDAEIRELLEAFGELRALNIVREAGPDSPCKGFLFCEYVEPAITDVAIQGLNGINIRDRQLAARRSDPDLVDARSSNLAHIAGSAAPLSIDGRRPSPILVLLNAVTEQDLADEAELKEIEIDILEEAKKYGEVLSLHIPRPPAPGDPPVSGLGKIFIEFASAADATAARFRLEGRDFDGNKVACDYLEPDRFHRRDFA